MTVTGCGWRDNECFAILTSGGANDSNLPDNALFENVEVSNGATGIYSTHLTGMAMINLAAMGNDPTPVYARNGRIINSRSTSRKRVTPAECQPVMMADS